MASCVVRIWLSCAQTDVVTVNAETTIVAMRIWFMSILPALSVASLVADNVKLSQVAPMSNAFCRRWVSMGP